MQLLEGMHINKLTRYIIATYAKFKYNWVDDELCCCGSQMQIQYINISCEAACRSAKEYAIDSYCKNEEIKSKCDDILYYTRGFIALSVYITFWFWL